MSDFLCSSGQITAECIESLIAIRYVLLAHVSFMTSNFMGHSGIARSFVWLKQFIILQPLVCEHSAKINIF